MPNKIAIKLLGVAFILSAITSCGNNDTVEPQKPNDEALTKHEELPEIYENPIQLPVANRATEAPDPFIYRFNGMYYLYMTTSGGYIRGYQSEDLINFEPVTGNGLADGIVYSYASDANKPQAQTPFAPEVIYHNGYFYLACSPNGLGHYILRSESPAGPFECISSNIGKSIDGSFFVDSNEDIYFYTAGGNNISMYRLQDDFTTFETNDDGQEFHAQILAASMDGWTEGPFMIQRDGQYYFTYTGTHYLSNDYRVDYAYCKEGSDISKISSFEEKDNVLLSVTDDFKGLGHSCTVLGPDMDSHYIVYHELKDDRSRGLCVSRLSFNGSKMIVNNPLKEMNFTPALPEFAAKTDENLYSNGNFILSDVSSDDDFTAEFNVFGLGKCVFGFKDENNYSYLEIKEDKLDIIQVKDGNENLLKSIELIKDYDFDFLHSIRLGYKDGLLDVYFDNIEKLNDFKCELTGGKIGYLSNNSFDEIGYTAFSNVAQGSSDSKQYNSHTILANAYDEKTSFLTGGSGLNLVEGETVAINKDSYNLTLKNEGDRATYRVYQDTDGSYYLNLRVDYKTVGKKIGVRLNDGDIKVYTANSGDRIHKKGDVYLNLGEMNLDEGQQYVSICNVGDEISFSEINIEENDDADDIISDFKADSNLSGFNTRGNMTPGTNGIAFDQGGYGEISTLGTYTNYTISVTLKVNEILNGGYFGFMLNSKNNSLKGRHNGDSNYVGGNYEDNYQGMKITFSDKRGSISNVNYNIEGISYGGFDVSYNNGDVIIMTVEKTNNNYVIYFNDEVVKEFSTNYSSLRGTLGFICHDANVTLQNLEIVTN